MISQIRKLFRPNKVYIISSYIEYENGAVINQIEKIVYSLKKANKLLEQFNKGVETNMRGIIVGLKIKKVVFKVIQYEVE